MVAKKTGRALFVPFHGKPWDDPWDIRQDTAQALLEGKEPVSYVITETVTYLDGGMRLALYDEERDEDFIEEYRNALVGETGKAIRCVLFQDMNGDGMLVHLSGEQLQCAYYPVVTLETAKLEMLLANKMESLAELAKGTRIHLQYGVKSGRYLLSDILRELSKKLHKK